MSVLDKKKGKKIYTRDINVATYEYDDNNIIVEGVLKDDRLCPTYTLLGRKQPSLTLHHMVVRMLVDSYSFIIKEIETEMPEAPEEECPETMKSLDKIKGMTISSGFSEAVRKKLKSTNGCSHFTALLLAMAPAALQGNFTKIAIKPFPEEVTFDVIKEFLGNSCYAWRIEGPLMKKIQQHFKDTHHKVK